MSGSPFENTRFRANVNVPSEEKPTTTSASGRSDLREIMKAGRTTKAKLESEMEKSMAAQAREQSTEKKLPKLDYDTMTPSECGKSVGFVYDNRMLKHVASKTLDYGKKHPERPERILKALERLCETDILKRLYLIEGREATNEELLSVHITDHISDMASTADIDDMEDMEMKQTMYDSVYFCKESYMSALISCGSTLSIVEKVLRGILKSGFALVRPPGHHAEAHTARGFCLFNNVAVAAKRAQSIAKDMGLVQSEGDFKVLILDWDVHHGNGTQNKFYSDPSVLYVSLHRFENGLFYPSSEDADFDRIGVEKGTGYNINIPWSGARMGNPEYYTAFEHIVMPIAQEFCPDLVLVSSGFDAGKGDPLGGFHVTPSLYGHMTHRLQSLADGKVVIVLEGGYNLRTVSESVQACTEALLNFSQETPDLQSNKHATPPRLKFPNTPGLKCICNTLEYIVQHWPHLEKHKAIVDEMLEKAEGMTIEKLQKGLESLVLADNSEGRRYGTRAKTGSAKKNDTKPEINTPSDVTDAIQASSQGETDFADFDEYSEKHWEAKQFEEPEKPSLTPNSTGTTKNSRLADNSEGHRYGTRAETGSAKKNDTKPEINTPSDVPDEFQASSQEDTDSADYDDFSEKHWEALEFEEPEKPSLTPNSTETTKNSRGSQDVLSTPTQLGIDDKPAGIPQHHEIGPESSKRTFAAENWQDALSEKQTLNASLPPSNESSFYSANSSLNSDIYTETNASTPQKLVITTSAEMNSSYLDEHLKKQKAGDDSPEDCGACASALPESKNSDSNVQEMRVVLSAFGYGGLDDMSAEELIAISQAGLPDDATGYTVPKDNCLHIEDALSAEVTESLDFDTQCHTCGHENENWTCLKCGKVFCGRFVNGHMVDHYNDTWHPVALSHSDLSIWCYKCDSYLNNYTIDVLKDVYRQAHILKHGTDLPS